MSLKPFLPALTLYHLTKPLVLDNLEERLATMVFVPCGDKDLSRAGFVPPLGETAKTLAYESQGHLHLQVMKEERKVPPSEVNRLLAEKVKAAEEAQGRSITKKERQQFKEEVFNALLPRAFSKRTLLRIWIDLQAQTLAVGTASDNMADLAVAVLRKALGSVPAVPFCPASRMSALMVQWPDGIGRPELGFWPGQSIALKSDGSTKLRAVNCGLLAQYEPVMVAVRENHEVEAISLEWRSTLWFTLTAGLVVNHIAMPAEFCDMPQRGDDEDPASAVAANAALATGVLRDFIADLRELIADESRPAREETEITADQVRALLQQHKDKTDSGGHLLKSDAMLALGVGPIVMDRLIAMAQAEMASELQLGLPAEQDDPLLVDAKQYILTSRRASVSSLQREFKIGYNRAGRIMERLEVLGVVSSPNSSGARDVLMPVPRPTPQGVAS